MEGWQKGLFEKNHLGQGQQVKSQIRSSRDGGQVDGSCLSMEPWSELSTLLAVGTNGSKQANSTSQAAAAAPREKRGLGHGQDTPTYLSPACPLLAPPDTSLLSE